VGTASHLSGALNFRAVSLSSCLTVLPIHKTTSRAFGRHLRTQSKPQVLLKGTDGRHSVVSAASNRDGEDRGAPQLFPAAKQVRIQLPSILLEVSCKEALNSTSLYTFLDSSFGVNEGTVITGVMVKEGPDETTNELYTATMALKDYLSRKTSKAILLVSDRSDVAEAAGADGVVLTGASLPVVVAKNQMGQGKVVGKIVESGEDAMGAAFDGSGLIVIENAGNTALLRAAREGQVSGSSVPVVGLYKGDVVPGLDGIIIEYDQSLTVELLADLRDRLLSVTDDQNTPLEQTDLGSGIGSFRAVATPTDAMSEVLSTAREDIIERQKVFLRKLIEFISTATPSLEEVAMLKDSLKQLDELFLVVIVGEFNSGKSAVVNAMLGNTVVPEGILPTTNEITVIKWAEKNNERVEQDTDGLFVRYTAANLLKEINIVDTPGTNVILDRQQRLTEEFIPRADLVLFVLSADRPFTDSEVKFLKYVRQWGKKVVFVVNKVDLLDSSEDVDKVVEFVEKNATRLLGVEGAKAIPVSAKQASQAKIEIRQKVGDESTGVLTAEERGYLASSDAWKASRFGDLESHVRDFLLGGVGDGDVPSESLKLKLQTPLFVADALLNASRSQLENELSVLRQDEESLRMVSSQLDAFRDEMNKEAKVQKAEIIQQTNRMVELIGSVVDQVLAISNWQALLPYYTNKKEEGLGKASSMLYSQNVSKDAMNRVNSIVEEHREWLRVNCARLEDNYKGFVAERLEAYEVELASSDPTGPDETITPASTVTMSMDMKTIGGILEAEVQTAVVSSVNTLAAAVMLSLLLTSILPNALEDLLAIGLGAAVGYASILNIPVRRMEAKKKVTEEINRLVEAVHTAMDAEQTKNMQACDSNVKELVRPLDEALRKEIERLTKDIDILNSSLARELEELREL
jgi:small GTP-binding protein